jgi:type VI secretion system protein ImpF
MPDLAVVEKLQPCLLDRLTDDEPEKTQESRAQRVISPQRYRAGVMRDLEWLLGASSHLSGEFDFDLAQFPEAQRSVINFGARHLFGLTSLKLREIQRQLAESLSAFEPRIDPTTLKVSANIQANMIALDIRGDLWAEEKPEHLHIKTSLDLEAGYCRMIG